jgi:uncharacterized membrane protein
MRDLMAGRPAETGQAWDVNNAGQVAGNIGSRAVLWQGGQTVELAVPGLSTNARDINERGDVTGWSISGQPAQSHVFRWRDGRALLSEGYSTEMVVEVAGIDSHGRVAGVVDDLIAGPRPVRWVAG